MTTGGYRGFNGGLRGRKVGSYRPMSEINVTPMVDVMLVLLVVFMITAPLLTVGVPVDLPKTKSAVITGQDEPLVITLNDKGELYVQDSVVPLEKLVARLVAVTENRKDTRIFVRGDRKIAYGKVMEVMSRVNVAGFTRVALITERPRESRKNARAEK